YRKSRNARTARTSESRRKKSTFWISISLVSQILLQLVASIHVQLIKDMVKVNFHGSYSDRQSCSNFLIVHSQCNQPRDFQFTWRQLTGQLRFDALPLLHSLGEVNALDIEASLAMVDGANTVLQRAGCHRLQHDAAGA